MLQQKRTHWIVGTINPIPSTTCVHPSTFHNVLILIFCSSKCSKIIIFAHNYFRKKASVYFDVYLSKVFLVKGLDTSNQL